MYHNPAPKCPISALTPTQMAKLERQRASANILAQDVARVAINDFYNSSLHFREEARSERSMRLPHINDLDSCIAATGQGLFFDTLRLVVLTDSGEINPLNELAALPKETRQWISKMFAPHRVSVGIVGQLPGFAVDGKYALEVDVKTQNVPFDLAYDAISALIGRTNGWMALPNGDKIGFHNADLTVNVPFATKPTLPADRGDIFGGMFEAKNNAKYVGYMCLTYTAKDVFRGQRYIRYVATDLDGQQRDVVLTLCNFDIKLYDKTQFHHITTSAYTTIGNNRRQLAASEHDNIHAAHHTPIFQQNGFSRLELRFDSEGFPKTKEDAYSVMSECFSEMVPKFCYREGFLERMEWLYDKNNAVQVALIQNKVGEPDRYNVAVVFLFNSYTFRANTEHIVGATKEQVKHFLTSTKIASIPMYVYVEQAGHVGIYTRSLVGATENKPNLEFLPPEKYTRNSCRAAWAQEKAEDVGLASGPFQITNRPFVFTEEQILVLRSDGSNKQPNLSTQAQRQKEAKQWVRDILIPAQKEKRAKLASAANIAEYKALPMSEAPETARLCGAGKTRKGFLVLALENSRGTINLYFVNKKLEEEIRGLIQSKLFTQYPIQFYKGRQTGTYKGNPVYNEATLVHGNSEKACNAHKELQEWELLFWDKDNFDKYRHIKIW